MSDNLKKEETAMSEVVENTAAVEEQAAPAVDTAEA